MQFPSMYVMAPGEFETLSEKVPTPYMRRDFELRECPSSASILVFGLGYYRVWVNGTEITKIISIYNTDGVKNKSERNYREPFRISFPLGHP